MPSWPTRRLHGTPTSNHAAPNSDPPRSESRSHPVQHNHHQQYPSLHGVPVLDPDDVASTSSPGKTPRHGRSLSHPFPSIFGVGKKSDKKGEETIDFDDTDSQEEYGPPMSPSFSGSPGGAILNRGFTPPVEQDLATGKCATCGSLVRWPRNLVSFRCTVCLMVNDLKPAPKGVFLEASRNDIVGANSEQVVHSTTSKTVAPLSLSRTRSLIDQSIATYLELHFPSENQGTQQFLTTLGGSSPSNDQSLLNADEKEVDAGTDHRGFGDSEFNGQAKLDLPPVMSPSKEALPSVCMPVRAHASPPSRAPPSPPTIDKQASVDAPSKVGGQDTSDRSKRIFRPLENYIVACFSDCGCLNASFAATRPAVPAKAMSENVLTTGPACPPKKRMDEDFPFPDLDAKTLLVGNFAENGLWWTGRARSQKVVRTLSEHAGTSSGLLSKRIRWAELEEWYRIVLSASYDWRSILHKIRSTLGVVSYEDCNQLSQDNERDIERDLTDSSIHLQRTLLKAVENLLRRPRRPLVDPGDYRFLVILLANPLLTPVDFTQSDTNTRKSSPQNGKQGQTALQQFSLSKEQRPAATSHDHTSIRRSNTGRHSGLLKRILGLMSNSSAGCQSQLVIWFLRAPEHLFKRFVELVGGFVTYRLTRQRGRKRSNSHNSFAGLVPSISTPEPGSPAQLHAALGTTGQAKRSEVECDFPSYGDDWQIRAAARVASLLFSANNNPTSSAASKSAVGVSTDSKMRTAAQRRAHSHGQTLPASSFYNTLLDYSDLIADFETWESRNGKFSFCQYPMFLSIWAKIHIMEHEARRQMETKAREAFFNSIMSRKVVSQYLVLRVRRNCLAEDSLRGVSEVVGAGQEDIKKGLRIEFSGEEGVDAGGLRKEWFLMLVREVFDPDHGLFVYDEDSRCCYFNSNSFETSDQFFLVGVVLGLAIYNSTILDVALPPFAFRKLLASAPSPNGLAPPLFRPAAKLTLDDLAEFRPSLARGLVHLLEYNGNVQETFCRDFVAEVDRYGQIVQIPLCTNGENRPVTNENREEFVELYVKYLLDTAVSRQYEPFKRGFFTVCGGNALSLFRPEEIELLVRGSDESLDIDALQAVAVYDGWSTEIEPRNEPVVQWFWRAFSHADARDQRRLLSFITSSDRIPAMGASNLVIKISCLGDDVNRFPVARTCFNMLGLYRYQHEATLESKLWTAVLESEGFGLK